MFLFKINDNKIFKKLGKSAYIRNGVGYGFISDEYLYDNCFLEIGFGRTRSGYGDWGGGFEYSTTCPLKVTIDRNLIVQKLETDSFYNSRDSEKMEVVAKSICKRLKIGSKLNIKDPVLRNSIDAIFNFIPCKSHIGHDVFEHPHMLEHYTEPSKKNYYNFRDSNSLVNG